jgi:hypothetical protein
MTALAQDEPGSKSRIDPDSPGLVSDCRLMLSFARKNGFVLPPPLVHEIGWLDSVLRALKIPPVSQLSAQLIWPIDVNGRAPRYVVRDPWNNPARPAAPVPATAAAAATAVAAAPLPAPAPSDTTAAATEAASDPADEASAAPAVPPSPTGAPARDPRVPGLTPEEVVLDVHSKLSLLIAPTTALSLQTSEPPAGKRHIFGGMPPLVQYVIVIAFFSAIGFAYSTAKVASRLQSVDSAIATVDAASTAATAALSNAAAASTPASAGPDAPAPSTDGGFADTASPARKGASRSAFTASGAKP